ncbi:MAG: hypothetical protein ACRCZE_01685, partial [Candidatus Altimarinota bacterium]
TNSTSTPTSSGGTGGIGGEGGMGSTASGGETSTSSSSTSSTGGGPTDCAAGTEGTPNNIESWGNDATAMLLVRSNTTTQYQASENGGESNKLTFALTASDKFPGYLIFYGENGLHLRLTDGAAPNPQDLYRLQGNISDIYPAECTDLQSESCLQQLVSWWEQCGSIDPKPSGCPAIDALPQGTSDLYNLDLDGEWLMLTPIECDM